jgi:amino acid transporter
MNPMIIFALLTLWLLTELKEFFLNGGATNKLAFVLLKIIFIFIMMVMCFFFNFFMKFFQSLPTPNFHDAMDKAYSIVQNRAENNIRDEKKYLNNNIKEIFNKGYNSH